MKIQRAYAAFGLCTFRLCLFKNVFINRLNWPYDSPHGLRLGGRLFQTCGPAAAKVLSPKQDICMRLS